MFKTRFQLILAWLSVGLLVHAEPLPKGHVFFQVTNLTVATTATKSFVLPAEVMRGYTVRGVARVKAANVSAKPNAWNGIKFMLAIDARSGKRWPQALLEAGTFDWQTARFSAKIPSDATAVTLCLGLERVTGQVWFEDMAITVAKPPPVAAPAAVAGPMFKGHDLDRLRGVMIHPNITAESLRTLGRDWQANLIRWQLIRHDTNTDYDQWLDGELKKLDAALPICAEVGLMVVLDLHSPPGGKKTQGGYVGSDTGLFSDRKAQEKFVEVWRYLAQRYRHVRPIWGYDIANEPVEDFIADDCDDWHGLAERAAQAIRAVDPVRAIICEAPPWGSPESLADFTPLSVSNVVYSVHMYVPSEFTHQGVFKPVKEPVVYPGLINGSLWDKAALEKVLQPVVDFQKRYNVHIYLGEFSAIRWAPGDSGCRYLKDCIDIFESHHWDWSYHAFREWNGWSVEHGPDRADNRPAATPTDRQKLLCSWFSQNQKPRP
jgi:endoglucanase